MKKSLCFLLILFMIPVSVFGIQGNEPAYADVVVYSNQSSHVLEFKERILTPDYDIIGVVGIPGGLPAIASIDFNFPDERALYLKEKMASTIIRTESVPLSPILPSLVNGWRALTPHELRVLEIKERIMTPDMP